LSVVLNVADTFCVAYFECLTSLTCIRGSFQKWENSMCRLSYIHRGHHDHVISLHS